MGIGAKWFYVRDDEDKVIDVFTKTKWTHFIEYAGLEKALVESGYRSPKNFVKERHMDKWLAYQVIKRMEK